MTNADVARISRPSIVDPLREEILHSLLDGRARYRVEQQETKKPPITLAKLMWEERT